MVCPVCNSPSENTTSCSHCGYVFSETRPPAIASKGPRRSLKIQFLANILWLVLPLYFCGRLLSSDAYKASLDLAKSSREVQKILGKHIHTQWLPIGSALRSYDSDFAEWSVSLSGSAGSGRLYGVANQIGTDWEFSRLTFVPAKGEPIIDLTPTPSRLDLPPVSVKKVYLIPLDLASEQSLTWAPAYYRAKLGVNVEVLPPVTLSPSLEDPTRHQLIGEKCIDFMVRSHRDLASDPSAILIGVTSRDMFISTYDWKYAVNLREYGRLAVVSAARLQPTNFPGKWNKELLNSRLRKMLTKNVVTLYFNLPLSNDSTSLLSAGAFSGKEVDYISGKIVGAEGRWDPFFNEGEPTVTMTVAPGKPAIWKLNAAGEPIPDIRTDFFTVDLAIGLFIQRKTDFYFDDDYPLEFRRVYRNADDKSRPFGVGANDSLDVFLIGQMGSFIDFVGEDGGREHFVHVDAKSGEPQELYRPPSAAGRFTEALYESGVWRLTSKDGWTYLFPYRPKAQGAQVTVLTGYIDPTGHKFEMVRDDSGDLLSIVTPSGKWLHFEHDVGHRVRRIRDSLGRAVQYDYDSGGRLVRVSDSEGRLESYTYNDRNEMLTVADGPGPPLLTNQYTSNNLIASQTLADGRHFEYGYNFTSRMVIRQNFLTEPNGLITYFDYVSDGYLQSLPVPPSHSDHSRTVNN
jgi:YD repeat-containing protein